MARANNNHITKKVLAIKSILLGNPTLYNVYLDVPNLSLFDILEHNRNGLAINCTFTGKNIVEVK